MGGPGAQVSSASAALVAYVVMATAGACGHGGGGGGSGLDAVGSQPRFEAATEAGNSAMDQLSYLASVPSGTQGDLVLLVAVAIGGECATMAPSPAVTTIMYGSGALVQQLALTGTTCNPMQTHSELWELVGPPTGSANVVVQLDGPSRTTISSALVFSGINQTTPIRGSSLATGAGANSTITISSNPGDLVVDVIGQGAQVIGPAAPAKLLFLDNVSEIDSLDNLAASATTSTATTVDLTWTFVSADEFQTLAVSLEP